jgi:hypothetical protein
MLKKIDNLDELLRYIKSLDQDEGIKIELSKIEKIYIAKYSFNFVLVLKNKDKEEYLKFNSLEELKNYLNKKIFFPVFISFY